MTEEHAQRIGSYVLDAGLDAHILTLGRGDEFCVRILNPQWHCWSFADWNAFQRERKKERKAQRKHAREEEVLHAIDYGEAFSLAM